MATLNAWWMKSWLWLWQRLLGAWDFQKEMARFSDYIAFNTELPMISRRGEVKSTAPSSVPFDRILRVVLMSEVGIQRGDLDGMLYLDALWNFVGHADHEARIQVHDMTEADLDAQMAGVDWDEVMRKGAEMFAHPNPENQ